MALRHVHADTLKLLPPLGCHAPVDPAKEVGLRPVAAEQRQLPGYRGLGMPGPLQKPGKGLPLLHGDHQIDVLLIQLQIVAVLPPFPGDPQQILHPLVHIGDLGLPLAGIPEKSVGNGLVQIPERHDLLPKVGNIRQDRVPDQAPVLAASKGHGVPHAEGRPVLAAKGVIQRMGPLLLSGQVPEKGPEPGPVPNRNQAEIPALPVGGQLLGQVSQHPAEAFAEKPQTERRGEDVLMVAAEPAAQHVREIFRQGFHSVTSIRQTGVVPTRSLEKTVDTL